MAAASVLLTPTAPVSASAQAPGPGFAASVSQGVPGAGAGGAFGATGNSAGGCVECRLDSAHDLAVLLAALQLKEKDMKDQRVHCEASARGLKLVAQSNAKDVAVVGWMMSTSFREYRYVGQLEEMHLRLPVAPLLNCLQIFSDRAALMLRYPDGPSNELFFTMEEDGAVTECRVRTLVMDEAPTAFGAFFAPGEPMSVLRPLQPEVWYHALIEFYELDAPEVALRVTVRAPRASEGEGAPAVVLRATTLTSDAEVELPRSAFEELSLTPEAVAAGEVTHCYPLSSVLASCLRAAKDSKGVKIRFNSEGVMSNQYILRSRGQRDLFCEAMISPLAEFPGAPMGARVSNSSGAPPQGAGESVGF